MTNISATVWASTLDGEPLAASSHILVGFLTDLRNTGMETEDGGVGASSLSGNGPTTLVRKWGAPPYLVRAGKARVELALMGGPRFVVAEATGAARTMPGPPDSAPAASWRCFALSQGGRRIAEAPASRTADGRLALDLDNAAAGTATMFWELVVKSENAPASSGL